MSNVQSPADLAKKYRKKAVVGLIALIALILAWISIKFVLFAIIFLSIVGLSFFLVNEIAEFFIKMGSLERAVAHLQQNVGKNTQLYDKELVELEVWYSKFLWRRWFYNNFTEKTGFTEEWRRNNYPQLYDETLRWWSKT